MKKITILFISIILLTGILEAKDTYRKPVDVKNPCNSVYFVASDGQLYHSGDFGLSFDQVIGVKYSKKKTIESNVSDDSFVILNGKTLEYSIDNKYEGNVIFRITDIYGNFNLININADLNRTGIIKLENYYKLIILNMENINGSIKTFKLIN